MNCNMMHGLPLSRRHADAEDIVADCMTSWLKDTGVNAVNMNSILEALRCFAKWTDQTQQATGMDTHMDANHFSGGLFTHIFLSDTSPPLNDRPAED